MSNKSLFDKLFNEVMGSDDMQGQSEEDALDISSTADSGAGEDMGGDDSLGDEGDVTFTLDRATAEKLKEVLSAALGGEEGDDDDEAFGDEEGESEDLGADFGGSEGGEDSESSAPSFGESPAVETMEELPTQKYVDAMTGKNNKVQGALAGKTNAGGEGSGEVTSAHPLKKASTSYVDGKGKTNVVNSDKYKQKNTKTSSYLTQ